MRCGRTNHYVRHSPFADASFIVFVGHGRVLLLPWPDEAGDVGEWSGFPKNEQFENLGHSQPQLERFFDTKARLGTSLNTDGSVAKVCESLVHLTGRF